MTADELRAELRACSIDCTGWAKLELQMALLFETGFRVVGKTTVRPPISR